MPKGSFTKDITLRIDQSASGAPQNWCHKKGHHPSVLTYKNSSLGNLVHKESSVFKSYIGAIQQDGKPP